MARTAAVRETSTAIPAAIHNSGRAIRLAIRDGAAEIAGIRPILFRRLGSARRSQLAGRLSIDFRCDPSCVGDQVTWAILDFVVDPRQVESNNTQADHDQTPHEKLQENHRAESFSGSMS